MPLDPLPFHKLSHLPGPPPLERDVLYGLSPKVLINFVINTNRRSTFGPLGSGRLPETSGDQMPAQNFTCQHNSASRRKNQSAARQSFIKLKYLHSIPDI